MDGNVAREHQDPKSRIGGTEVMNLEGPPVCDTYEDLRDETLSDDQLGCVRLALHIRGYRGTIVNTDPTGEEAGLLVHASRGHHQLSRKSNDIGGIRT